MYCKNCGKIIAHESKFCNFCGADQQQTQTNSSGDLKKDTVKTDFSLIERNKIDQLFGIKVTKKLIGVYVTWIFLNFIALILTWDYGTDRLFWPFENHSDFEDYDFTEFLFFTLTPLMVLIVNGFFFRKKSVGTSASSISSHNEGDFNQDSTFNPDRIVIIQGIVLLFISIFLNLTAYNDFYPFIVLVIFIIRVIVTIRVIRIAESLNRNKTGWGIFAFVLPAVALIAIGFQRKLLSAKKK